MTHETFWFRGHGPRDSDETQGHYRHQDQFGPVPIWHRGHSQGPDVILEGGGFCRRPLIDDQAASSACAEECRRPSFRQPVFRCHP